MIRLCEVPIVAPELRREESLLQIADAFQQLDAVASEILGRVNKRVEVQRSVLTDIENRVQLAQGKVNHLKGSKKAIQVFSSSKFPSNTAGYEPLFKPPCNKDMNTKHQLLVQEELKPVDSKSIKDRLNFFRVAQPAPKSRMFNNLTSEGELVEGGLGAPPQGIRSASSYLIFNSSTNPYRSHMRVDPLDAPTRRAPEEAEAEVALEDAPASLGGSEIRQLLPKSYSYSPDLGAVPDLDVPVYLPDLPGVAEISFEEAMGSIAPSFLPTCDILPELPDLGLPEVSEVSGLPPISAPPAPSSAPPPPAPPPPNVPPPPPAPRVAAPPAPPPPPAPGAPTAAPSGGAATASGGADGASGGRDDLLAAIRGAKAKKLKSVEERKRERKEEIKKEKESGSGGGDLMGDLMAQLNQRRKGISGDKKSTPSPGKSTGSGSAMDKVSAMIPPPSMKERSESHASSGATSDDDGWD